MLDLEDGWADDDSNLAIKEDAWLNAIQFLATNALRHYEKYNIWIPTPHICPYSDIAVDIEWSLPTRVLLIHARLLVGAEEYLYTYYGDNNQKPRSDITEGGFNEGGYNESLMKWLTQYKNPV